MYTAQTRPDGPIRTQTLQDEKTRLGKLLNTTTACRNTTTIRGMTRSGYALHTTTGN